MRQKDDLDFQIFLNNCRVGKVSEKDVEFINKRICGTGHKLENECNDYSNTINLCSIHAKRKHFLDMYHKTLKNPTFITIESKDVDGAGNILSENIRKRIDSTPSTLERTLTLYKDCQIILVKNIDVPGGIVNGLIGTYIDHTDKVLVMKLQNNSVIPIPKTKQKVVCNLNLNYDTFRIQFPVMNASAITIHRVQGATLKRCHSSIDNSLFSNGQAYVALSRVQNSKDLHLKFFDKDAIKVDADVVNLLEYIKVKKTMKNYVNLEQAPCKKETYVDENKCNLSSYN